MDITQISNAAGQPVRRQTSPAQGLPTGKSDPSVQISFTDIINQARQLPEEDTAALERARQLLLAGQLETEDNIRQAADDIVRFGI